MLTGLESGAGLDVVIWLQVHGNPVFDALAQAMHVAGQTLTYMVLLTFIYWAVDRTLGLRLLFIVLAASALTETVKAVFDRPRPHFAYPDQVTALVEQTGPGLPSGHTLIALAAWGLLAWHFRRRWLTILAAVIVLVMGWARMYAGVHYPQDVLAGLLLGGLLLAAAIRWEPALTRWWAGQGLPLQIGSILLLALLTPPLTAFSEAGLTASGLVLGAGLGLLWERRALGFELRPEPTRRALNFALGLALTLAVYLGLSAVMRGQEPEAAWRVIRYALLGLVVGSVWPWISTRAGLTHATRRRADFAVD